MMYSYWLHWCGHCNSLFFLHNSPQPVNKRSRTTVNHFIIKSQNTIKLTAKRQRSVDHHIFFQGNQKCWTNFNPLQLLKNTWISQPSFSEASKRPFKMQISTKECVHWNCWISFNPNHKSVKRSALKNMKNCTSDICCGCSMTILNWTIRLNFSLLAHNNNSWKLKVDITSICVVTQTIIPYSYCKESQFMVWLRVIHV